MDEQNRTTEEYSAQNEDSNESGQSGYVSFEPDADPASPANNAYGRNADAYGAQTGNGANGYDYGSPNDYGNPNSYGNPGGYGNYGANPDGYPGYGANPNGYPYYQAGGGKGNDTAFGIVSLVLGIVSLLLFCTCINWITGILAIIFGAMQLVNNREKGPAIAGIVIAAISLVMTIVLYIGLFFVADEGANSFYNDYYGNGSYYDDIYDDYYDGRGAGGNDQFLVY